MNDDFERKLLGLRRTDPTPGWKADILARARREADAIPMRPPRVLLFAWAAAWAAIVVLSVGTPREAEEQQGSDAAAVSTSPTPPFIAFERRYTFNNDLP